MKSSIDPQPGNDPGTPDIDASSEPVAVVADAEPKPPGHPVDHEPTLEDLTVPELEEKVAGLGIVVAGSGKDGAVVKADLIEALERNVAPVGRPPLITVAQAAAAPINPQED